MPPDAPPDPRSILDWATYYAGLGWRIFPAGHGEDRKRPLAGLAWSQYRQRAATDGELQAWFGNGRASVPAVILGQPSGGLCCRDFDVADAYHAWTLDHPDLVDELATVETGRGFHVYFILTDGEYYDTCADGEVRGNAGHYCLLPPAVHHNRKTYSWLVGPNPDSLRRFTLAGARALGLIPEGSTATGTPKYTEGTERYTEGTEGTETPWAPSVYLLEVLEVQQVIRRCLPDGEGQRDRALFELAQRLKGLPAVANLHIAALRPLVQRWYELALPKIGSKNFMESWGGFCRKWQEVRFPKGAYMQTILERAKAQPVAGVEDERLAVLAGMCRELQAEAGDAPFYLSVRDAAKPFGVTPRTGAAWLWALVGDGYLKEVEKGGGTDGPRKATRWRFIGKEAP